MRFKRIHPSPLLQPFVKYYWLLEADVHGAPFSQTLFPFDSFELILNLSKAPLLQTQQGLQENSQMESLFAGQFTKPFDLHYPRGHKSAGISLQPWAGNLLFNIPAHQFTDRLTLLEDIEKQSCLGERLSEAVGEAEYFNCFEQYLLEKMKTLAVNPLSSIIVQSIQQASSVRQLQEMTRKMGYSKRRIEQVFLASSGLSMGLYFRKIRFKKVLHSMLSDKSSSLTSIGLDAGYYDQAHFIREFKEFSGVTPKAFLSGIAKKNTGTDMSELLVFTRETPAGLCH